MEIDIDKYISEDEKRQIALDVFTKRIESEMFKTHKGSVQSDTEIQRIVGNISHSIIFNEVKKYIPDYIELIKEKTLEQLHESSFHYQLFKRKDAWEKEESLVVTYMNEVIRSEKENIQNKIRETISIYDYSKDVSESISSEFSEMASTLDRLSELFHHKTK